MIDNTETVFAPLCLDALSARIAEHAGFNFVYVSGGALGYAHAVSEAMLGLNELADVVRYIRARSGVKVIVDGGVGFGDAVHVSRAVQVFEAAGASAIEIEDQVAPKRVSHHRGIEHLIPCDDMVDKITVAVSCRQSATTQIIARTGAVKNESLDAALERCTRYVAAGADMILIMADTDEAWQQIREAIQVPLVTFAPFAGRSAADWNKRGVSLVFDPFTTQVAHVINMQETYRRFFAGETQALSQADLFESYNQLDEIAGLKEFYDIEDATTLA
jgi:2-methylisocitrate lyase-like PEP mutase family enzyme